MARLSRAEMQDQNRMKVIGAAHHEFTEYGFRGAKIDRIAEQAELTRGAVYSNFPSKRALYFAVLAESAGRPEEGHPPTARTAADALADFARAWMSRLPLATQDDHSAPRLARDLLPEIIADERVRVPYAQLVALSAVVLGGCLEALPPHAARMVRVAAAALTTLQGATQLCAAAPGFVEPFDLVRSVQRLAELDLDDEWAPTHLPYVSPARQEDRPWSPPAADDLLRDKPAPLDADGVVAVLGLHRLAAIEEALRAAPAAETVTLVAVTGEPGELAPLARLILVDLRGCLLASVPHSAWSRLRIVLDDTGVLARAAGVPAVSDATETAIRIRAGRIIARADGYGATHAAAAA